MLQDAIEQFVVIFSHQSIEVYKIRTTPKKKCQEGGRRRGIASCLPHAQLSISTNLQFIMKLTLN